MDGRAVGSKGHVFSYVVVVNTGGCVALTDGLIAFFQRADSEVVKLLCLRPLPALA